ncbi:AraC family transcriptional regulator [Shimia isoporae]|uniref:AraC family transcriptional regulator n=1 Tax=Shimia isoporae TaxID=647720 RepID=A0A4R1N445_9RHOB|nr:AraC family transcriptional regulator [Shimia isoporae]TCK98854.1 AraC family transcriptional regulator [Shimia isoporae]
MLQSPSPRYTFVKSQLEKDLGATAAKEIVSAAGLLGVREAEATVQDEARLIEFAVKKSNRPELAAQLGMAFRHSSTLSAFIARSSETLREAVLGVAHFLRPTDPTTVIERFEDGENETLRVYSREPQLLMNLPFQEFLVFALLARMRTVAGRELRPRSVQIKHGRSGDIRAYERLVGSPVLFGSKNTGIVFERAVLDQRLATHDAVLAAHLRRLGEVEIAESTQRRETLAEKVRRSILDGFPGKLKSREEVAEELGLSRRSMTRKLEAESTSYRDLATGIRLDLARTYLGQGLSVTETSYYLGYASQAVFSSTFKKWTGSTPKEFSKSHR